MSLRQDLSWQRAIQRSFHFRGSPGNFIFATLLAALACKPYKLVAGLARTQILMFQLKGSHLPKNSARQLATSCVFVFYRHLLVHFICIYIYFSVQLGEVFVVHLS